MDGGRGASADAEGHVRLYVSKTGHALHEYEDRLQHCAVAVRQYHWLLFMLFGVGILIHVLPRYFLSGSGVPGFPFLASIIAIFSGTQLFALGIIGEYLARMHFRMMDRPSYAIREVVAVPESKGTA